MLSKDDLVKAKKAQQDKEKEEEYLRYQEKQKAKAAERARINEVLQILRQYPTLAKNVSKKTVSIPCFDGFRHGGFLGLFTNANFTNRNAWYIGRVKYYSSISPYSGSETQKEYERNMIRSGEGHVHASHDSPYCYIDETGQCWIQIDYTSGAIQGRRVYYPVNTENMAEALWKDCIDCFDFWERACSEFKGKERDILKEKYRYVPYEQLVDEYFKLNLLS